MEAAAAERTGSVAEALANARRLLKVDPALAQEQAAEILKIEPNSGGAALALGLALAHGARSATS